MRALDDPVEEAVICEEQPFSKKWSYFYFWMVKLIITSKRATNLPKIDGYEASR